jgi:hypothetical protein
MQDIKATKNLKDEQYYIDLYDKFTIKECHEHIKIYSEEKPPIPPESFELRDLKNNVKKMIGDVALCFLKGNKFASKSETIRRWIQRDKMLDELIENTSPSKDIACIHCYNPMTCKEKEIYWGDNTRVLFFFYCEKCKENRAFYDNGEEFQVAPDKCTKCQNTVQRKYSRKGNKVTIKLICPQCKFTDKEIWDFNERTKENIDKNFIADRERFCLSKEEGLKYLTGIDNLKQVTRSFEEAEERKKQRELYDAVAKVKKLNISDVEKLVAKSLEKEGFIRLKLENPQMSRDIKIEFTVQDSKSGIHEHDRKMKLKKVINKALLETNWKLIDDGIYYKLGILSGRLRGLEHEEDLMKLVQARQKKEKE